MTDSSQSVVFEGTFDAVQEHYHRLLFTDGLPIVPPTRARIDAFLARTRHAPDAVLGVVLPSNVEVTPWNIAVNGVMAGCRPEYMPVLVAVASAIAEPKFRVQDAGSTPGWESLVIINGPVVKDLGFNCHGGVMRVGSQANSTVGRFLRLYLRNVAGLRVPPGDTDKATIGMNFNVALAENEDLAREIGWPTFAEERGFGPDESVVTVQSVVGTSLPIYSAGDTAGEHADLLAEVVGKQAWGYWAACSLWFGEFYPLLVVSPSVARVLASDGGTKDALRRRFYETAWFAAGEIERYARAVGFTNFDFETMVGDGRVPKSYAESKDPERLLPLYLDEGAHIGILVAGDAGRNQSRGYAQNHRQGPPVSKRIEA